jgi:hypothetical protein
MRLQVPFGFGSKMSTQGFIRSIAQAPWSIAARFGWAEHSVLKQLSDRLSIHDICPEVELAFAGQPKLARGIELYFCRKYSLMKLKEIGVYFGK